VVAEYFHCYSCSRWILWIDRIIYLLQNANLLFNILKNMYSHKLNLEESVELHEIISFQDS